jgi:hypothetical protein
MVQFIVAVYYRERIRLKSAKGGGAWGRVQETYTYGAFQWSHDCYDCADDGHDDIRGRQ